MHTRLFATLLLGLLTLGTAAWAGDDTPDNLQNTAAPVRPHFPAQPGQQRPIPVPEEESVLLMGVGGVLLLARRLRRARRQEPKSCA